MHCDDDVAQNDHGGDHDDVGIPRSSCSVTIARSVTISWEGEGRGDFCRGERGSRDYETRGPTGDKGNRENRLKARLCEMNGNVRGKWPTVSGGGIFRLIARPGPDTTSRDCFSSATREPL